MIREILRDKWTEVFKILTDEQLGLGLDAKGKVIGRYSKATEGYAADPENRPRQPKIAGEPFNFEWTGGLFDELYLTFDSKDSYTLFSYDAKASFLKVRQHCSKCLVQAVVQAIQEGLDSPVGALNCLLCWSCSRYTGCADIPLAPRLISIRAHEPITEGLFSTAFPFNSQHAQ